jgi:hypothetical protein
MTLGDEQGGEPLEHVGAPSSFRECAATAPGDRNGGDAIATAPAPVTIEPSPKDGGDPCRLARRKVSCGGAAAGHAICAEGQGAAGVSRQRGGLHPLLRSHCE